MFCMKLKFVWMKFRCCWAAHMIVSICVDENFDCSRFVRNISRCLNWISNKVNEHSRFSKLLLMKRVDLFNLVVWQFCCFKWKFEMFEWNLDLFQVVLMKNLDCSIFVNKMCSLLYDMQYEHYYEWWGALPQAVSHRCRSPYYNKCTMRIDLYFVGTRVVGSSDAASTPGYCQPVT